MGLERAQPIYFLIIILETTFTQQIFMELLLCAKYCCRYQGIITESTDKAPETPPLSESKLLRVG